MTRWRSGCIGGRREAPDDDTAFEKFRRDRAILLHEAWQSLTTELCSTMARSPRSA